MTFIRMSILSLTLALAVLQNASAQSVPSSPIQSDTFSSVVTFIGTTPQRVYERFGRPSESHVERFCCRIWSYAGDTLVHVYNVDGGGVVAFLYGKYAQGILVNGVVFDNLDAVQFWKLSDFFPQGTPRANLLAMCLSEDFYHQIPGDHGTKQLSEKALWSGPHGTSFYALYRTDGRMSSVYDPVSGRDIVKPVRDIDSLRLLRWGYFAGTAQITDLHFGSHHGQGTDYSMGQWSGPSCTK